MPIHEAALWSAYQQTRYVAWPQADGAAGRAAKVAELSVRAGAPRPAELVIKVGTATPALDALLAAQATASWCFVTAANPASERLPEAENLERNRVLLAELEAAGLVVWPGEGRGAEGTWPPEPSFLVLGLDRARARELGRRYGQNAVVFGEAGRPAELIDCRGCGSLPGGARG